MREGVLYLDVCVLGRGKKTRAVRAERLVHLRRSWRKLRGPSQVTMPSHAVLMYLACT